MVIDGIYNYFEGGGSVGLMINVEGLPKSIKANGNQLTVKSEFHITLIDARTIATLIDATKVKSIEEEILKDFKEYIKKLPFEKYKIFHKFRFVQRDKRKTVIAMAYVDNLEGFFELLQQKYKKDIPTQPTHVTIYTLQPDKGIGILSDEQLNKDSSPIDIDELANLKFDRKLNTT